MYSLGIDLGGTKTALGLVSQKGELIKESRFPTSRNGFSQYCKELTTHIHDFLGQETVSAIGVGCAGQIELGSGTIFHSPNLGWTNAPLGAELSKAFLGIPVCVDNDVRASTLGEYLFGNHKNPQSFVNVFLGTGIGSGIILNQRFLRGASNSAGEIGHTTLNMYGPKAPSHNHGVYEYYASGTALTRLGQEWYLKSKDKHPLVEKFKIRCAEEITGPMIGELAMDGNQEAMRIIRQIGIHAGAGIVNVINLLNPEVITYGGGLTDLGDMLIRPMIQTIEERAIPTALRAVTLKKAVLGNQAPLLGSAHLYRIDSSGKILIS